MTMTPSAKHLLAKTIRGLREHLTDALAGATEAADRLSVPPQHADLVESTAVRRGRLEAWLAEQLRAEGTVKRKGQASQGPSNSNYPLCRTSATKPSSFSSRVTVYSTSSSGEFPKQPRATSPQTATAAS